MSQDTGTRDRGLIVDCALVVLLPSAILGIVRWVEDSLLVDWSIVFLQGTRESAMFSAFSLHYITKTIWTNRHNCFMVSNIMGMSQPSTMTTQLCYFFILKSDPELVFRSSVIVIPWQQRV